MCWMKERMFKADKNAEIISVYENMYKLSNDKSVVEIIDKISKLFVNLFRTFFSTDN